MANRLVNREEIRLAKSDDFKTVKTKALFLNYGKPKYYIG